MDDLPCALDDTTLVLVGLMGAGKTSVGKRLAERLGRPFVDADREIETLAGMSVSDIFERMGEDRFRAEERRVIAELLSRQGLVLATGGGAFMNGDTRRLIAQNALSIWLKADINLLLGRVTRRNTRPLLATGDPRAILESLIETRYPVYAEADITVECADGPHDSMVNKILAALRNAYATDHANTR